MSTQLQRYQQGNLRKWLEETLLEIADQCNIQIVWDADVAMASGVLAAVGGLVGALVGGRLGASIGVGLGGYLGLSSGLKPLREVWQEVKPQLEGLLDLIHDFLKKIDRADLLKAFGIVMACIVNRKLLVKEISLFISMTILKEVRSAYSENSIKYH